MPKCFCASRNCNGMEVHQRTLQNHEREDKRARVVAVVSASQAAQEAQDAEISAYISSLTLSDSISNPHLTGGVPQDLRETHVSELSALISSLNSPYPSSERSEDDELSTLFSSLNVSGHESTDNTLRLTDNNKVELSLHLLKDIDRELGPLCSEVESRLMTLSPPSYQTSIFPLSHQLVAARNLQDRLANITCKTPSVRNCKKSIVERLQALLVILKKSQRLWVKAARKSPQERKDEETSVYLTDHHRVAILDGVDPLVQVSIFMMTAMQIVMRTSRRGCRFLLVMLQYIIQLAFWRSDSPLSLKNKKLLADFPVDPDTATSKFHLEGKSTIYAVCPNNNCHKTYAPRFEPASPIPLYPKTCSYREFVDGEECGTCLTCPRVIGTRKIEVPIKRFVSFSFTDYLAGLLCRPGFEDRMDYPSSSDQDENGIATDIFDGKFLREFRDHDGQPFRSSGHIGRYAFSLCVDFFNPFTNKQAGKKVSVGIISLVCLNLPASIRYKSENMFLAGVIPGPKEPSKGQLNHYLTPLVDELSVLWHPGVQYSRTYNYPEGRLVMCALAALICDLLAARATGGFAGVTHEHLCSVCHCKRSNGSLGRTDYLSWQRKTDEECRQSANMYKNAKDETTQRSIFEKTGMRCSELLRLPYFDISRSVVVDSMHNLFLGLIKAHFSVILGTDASTYRETPVIEITFAPTPDNFKNVEKNSVLTLKKWLGTATTSIFPGGEQQAIVKFATFHLKALRFVCEQVGHLPPMQGITLTRHHYAVALSEWRFAQIETRNVGADSATVLGHVFNADDMEHIRTDIARLLTPTWITSVPSNFGVAGHGKLKADQWRALGTIHLPLSLISLWDVDGPDGADDARSRRCREILQVTISLLSAVIIASSHTTSTENADAYLRHMTDYLDGVKRLFPDYKFLPNHHMAMHIHEFLLLFGPVHAWWTFPFERMIGMLQRMPHNGKIGELEETIAHAYTRSANLRALVFKSECPEVIQNCQPFFQKLVDPQFRGTLMTDMSSFSDVVQLDEDEDDTLIWNPRTARPFPDELIAAFPQFQSSRAQFCSSITINNFIYSTSSKHLGNSCVIVHPDNNNVLNNYPARISHIFQVMRADAVQTYIAVRRHLPATHVRDSYTRYPVLRAQFWEAQLGDLELVRPTQIECHFACLDLRRGGRDLIVAMSLSRDYQELTMRY